MEFSSALHEYIEGWIESHNTTWDWLMKAAGMSGPVGTGIRKGTVPQPKTLAKLAEVIGVPRRKLLELAGHVTAEELEPEEIDIADPDIRLFFRNHDWDDMTPDEQEIIRFAFKTAKAMKLLREGDQGDQE